MSVVASYTKAPGSTLDYSLDWGSWLQAGEIIVGSTWAITPSQAPQTGDATIQQSAVVIAITTAWLQAGVVGVQYTVTNTVTTSLGRVDERSILVDVENR